MDAEDIVQEALIKFIGSQDELSNPDPAISRNIIRVVHDMLACRKHQNSSPSGLQNGITQESWQNYLRIQRSPPHVDSEKLVVLLEEAKKRLNKTQADILDEFIKQHQKNDSLPSYHMLDYDEIAAQIATRDRQYTKQWISQQLTGRQYMSGNGITDKIKRAASALSEKDPEIKDIADYVINTLERKQKAYRGHDI